MINKMELSNQASTIRRKMGEDESSPIDIFSVAQMIPKLTIVRYPLGENISGACLKSDMSAIIAVNSKMSIGRQRFTLAHELYHYFFDTENVSSVCSSQMGVGNDNEKRADKFASYFLMPSAALYEMIQTYKKGEKRRLRADEIVKLEQYFGMSRQAMLYRLQEECEISSTDATDLQQGVISLAARLGYDTSLYRASPENKSKSVLGHYVLQAETLFEKDLISNGKYEELLLDAFRDDIVYGEDTEEGDIID